MIYYYNERVSCMKCINGHRAAGCAHIDRDLYTISGRGRPNTRYGKTRYRFLAGTVRFCAMTYVPIFKPGTDNTYTHNGEMPTRTVQCLHIDPITPFQGVELINDGDDDTVIYPYIKFDTYFEKHCNVSIWDHNKEERTYNMQDGIVASEHPLRSVKANVSCVKSANSPIVYYRLTPPASHARPYHALPHDTPNELLQPLEKLRQKVQSCTRAEFLFDKLFEIPTAEGFYTVESCGPIGLRVEPSQYLRVEKKKKGESSSYGKNDSYEFVESKPTCEEKGSARQGNQSSRVVKQPRKGNTRIFKYGDLGYQQAVSIAQHLNQVNNIQRHKMGSYSEDTANIPCLKLGDVKEDSEVFEDLTENEWFNQAIMGVRPGSNTSFGDESFGDNSSDMATTLSGNSFQDNQHPSPSRHTPMYRGNITLTQITPLFSQMLNSRVPGQSPDTQVTGNYGSSFSTRQGTNNSQPGHQVYYSSSPGSNRLITSGRPSGTFQATAQGHVQFNEPLMRNGPPQPHSSSSHGLPHIDFVLNTRASSQGYNQAENYPSTVRDALEEAKVKLQNGEELSQEHINDMIIQSGNFLAQADDLL